MPKYHLLGSIRPEYKADGRADLHRLRDTHAVLQLDGVLRSCGYEFGSILVNAPAPFRQRYAEALRLSPPALHASDLLLQTTRPPLDDADVQQDDENRNVRRDGDRSGLPLEDAVLRDLRKFFVCLNRTKVELSPRYAQFAGPFAVAEYYQYAGKGRTGGVVKKHGEALRKASGRLALGYVAMIPRMSEAPCRLLTLFGMGGFETLVLSCILRDAEPQLVKSMLKSQEPRLAIVEFQIPEQAPYPALRFDLTELAPRVHVCSRS